MTDRPGCSSTTSAAARGGIGCAGDGDAGIRLLQRGGIIHAVTGHGHDVIVLLQTVDDAEFVIWKYLREPAGFFNQPDEVYSAVPLLSSSRIPRCGAAHEPLADIA